MEGKKYTFNKFHGGNLEGNLGGVKKKKEGREKWGIIV